MSASGRIVQVSVSNGGVPKQAVAFADVGGDGLAGDAQRHREIHGGPERAVCLFSLEVIEALRAEGHPISPGAIGENVTIAGLDWGSIMPGTRFRLGGAVELEVTRYTTPCKAIAGAFSDANFARVLQTRHPGFSRVYCRVLVSGRIMPGDRVELLSQER